MCKTLAKLVEWLASTCVPLTAYRNLSWKRLMGLDKYDGVILGGVGDMFSRFLCKALLNVTCKETTRAFEVDQLRGGSAAAVEGATNCMASLWDVHKNDEDD